MSKVEYSDSRYNLWKFFNDEHSLILLDREMDDIINAVEEYQNEQVKATATPNQTSDEQNDVSPLVIGSFSCSIDKSCKDSSMFPKCGSCVYLIPNDR